MAEAAAILLTFILPLKFGSISGVPEMPLTYWSDVFGVILGAWPAPLLPPLAGILLALTLCLTPARPFKSLPLRAFAALWGALAFISLLGFVNASTWDFAMHAVSHTFGLACYVASLCLLLENRPSFFKWIMGALVCAALLSALSGFNQYYSGFEATRQFAYEQEQKAGVSFLHGQFKSRLEESRVSADFTICNSYAGYIILTAPLVLALAWSFGGRIQPPGLSRIVLTLPPAALFLFLLYQTRSRAAILALGLAAFIVVFALPFSRWLRLGAAAALPLAAAAFVVMVKMGRGFASMEFRFDYFKAALKMMLEQPWCGTGWGDFFHDYMKIKLLANDEAPHSPHNFVLSFASQTGILGFVVSAAILALPLLIGAVVLRKKAEREGGMKPGVELALLFGYLAWALHSLSEVSFETPGSAGVAAAFAALLLSREGFNLSLPRLEFLTMESNPRWRAGWICFLALCIALLAGTLHYGRRMLLADMAFSRLHSLCDPRFMSREEWEAVSPDKAMASLKACTELAPESPFPWATAADFMMSKGYPADALLMLDEAIKRSPERASFHFKKYLILSRLPGGQAEAAANLERARELFPKNPEYIAAGNGSR